MGLSIKNEEVEARVRRLTELTGLGVTEAVDLAVTEKIARTEASLQTEQVRRREAIEAVIAKYGRLSRLDQKQIDEEMYDEFGLPK